MMLKKINDKIIVKLDNAYVTLNEYESVEFIVKCLRALSEVKNAISNNINELQVLRTDHCQIQMNILFKSNQIYIECKYGHLILSLLEFERECANMLEIMSSCYDVGDFKVKDIDAMFLEQVLGIDLPFIANAELEFIRIEELRNFSIENPLGTHLSEGRYYKQISSGNYINYPNHINNFIGQTNEERTKSVLESMKEHNYAANGKYIIVYNESNVIRDGEHRAAALYYLYGNIEIPVLRIKFSRNYYSYKLFYLKGM